MIIIVMTIVMIDKYQIMNFDRRCGGDSAARVRWSDSHEPRSRVKLAETPVFSRSQRLST